MFNTAGKQFISVTDNRFGLMVCNPSILKLPIPMEWLKKCIGGSVYMKIFSCVLDTNTCIHDTNAYIKGAKAYMHDIHAICSISR